MYIDDIKLFARNEKGIKNPNTGCEDIQAGWNLVYKMCHANHEK